MSRFQSTILILISIAVLYFAKEVFVPLALAGLLAMLLAGPVAKLEKWRLPRSAAVTICVMLAFLAITGIGWVVGLQVISLAEEMGQYQKEIADKFHSLRGDGGGTFNKLQNSVKGVESAVIGSESPANPATTQSSTKPSPTAMVVNSVAKPETEPQKLNPDKGTVEPSAMPQGTKERPYFTIPISAQQTPLEVLTSTLGLALGPLGTAGIVIVFVFFILLEREDLRDRMIRLVSQGKYTVTTTALDDGVTRVLKFLRAQVIVNGTYGIAVALSLWIIGLTLGGDGPSTFPSFLLWGLLATVLRFIPYIGPWIAASFPLLLSLAVYHGFTVFIVVVSVFVVIELVTSNLMEPQLYGATTGLSTMAILVSAIFWTWLWGPIGLVLATPLTVCAMVAGRYAPPLRFLEVLLGDKPAMSPPERVYQRLLASDEDEAYEIAAETLDESGLLSAFDEAVLPALAMSESDTAEGLLTDDREIDVRAGMRRLIDALGQKAVERKKTIDEAEARKKEKDAPAKSDGVADVAIAAPPAPPKTRVAVLPAHDEADELAGLMLTYVLQGNGYEVMNFSQNALASEMVEAVVKFDPHAILISSTPPAAVSHVRYLLRRLADQLPPERTSIGIWTSRADLDTLSRRLDAKTMPLSNTLREAAQSIHKITESARNIAVTAS